MSIFEVLDKGARRCRLLDKENVNCCGVIQNPPHCFNSTLLIMFKCQLPVYHSENILYASCLSVRMQMFCMRPTVPVYHC
jgi:hypothetical protein